MKTSAATEPASRSPVSQKKKVRCRTTNIIIA
jgi:hypothetical protein